MSGRWDLTAVRCAGPCRCARGTCDRCLRRLGLLEPNESVDELVPRLRARLEQYIEQAARAELEGDSQAAASARSGARGVVERLEEIGVKL